MAPPLFAALKLNFEFNTDKSPYILKIAPPSYTAPFEENTALSMDKSEFKSQMAPPNRELQLVKFEFSIIIDEFFKYNAPPASFVDESNLNLVFLIVNLLDPSQAIAPP